MNGILIRTEEARDFEAVFNVNAAAFNQENEAKLVDLLRKSNAFVPELSLVAVKEDEIVGHILFTKIEIVNGNQKHQSLALAPMAVLPECQHQNIGSALIKHGLEKAKAFGYGSIIVLGHEKYYPKFGFVPAEKWKISAPFEVPSEAFMAIELIPDALKNVSGTVVYPEEFLTVT